MPGKMKVSKKPVTQADLQQLKKEILAKQEQNKKEIINAFKAETEAQRVDLFGAHKDELDIVAGEKDAPSQWKTIPRRLLTVEMAVGKIKDHLEIS